MEMNQTITDTAFVSKLNKIQILNYIRHNGGVTRPEIAKALGLSLPTVNRQVASLIRVENLVRELGAGDIKRGRPPKLLEFSGDDRYLVGIHMGAKRISGILVNLNAERVAENSIPPDDDHHYGIMIRSTARLIHNLISDAGVNAKYVLGVGVGIGGLIEKPHNRLLYSATFNWKNKKIANDLSRKIKKPVFFDHAARVMALGELCYGIGNRIDNFICILWGYGIGAASIINRTPYYGIKGMACEFGHIPIGPEVGAQCKCGAFGCLETLASGWAIEEQLQRLLPQHPESLLHTKRGKKSSITTAKNAAEAARSGDDFCQSILNRAADHMGTGLATLINLYNPNAIVLGGGMMNMRDLVFERMLEVARRRSLPDINQSVIIQPATLGDDCKTMGAVALILNEVLNLNLPSFPAND